MATKEVTVQEGVEQVADGLEEIAVAASGGMSKTVLLNSGVAIGIGVGYLVAKKRLEDHYSQLAQDEIDEIRRLYIQKSEKFHDQQPINRASGEKETLAEVMRRAGYRAPTPEDIEATKAEQAAVDEEAMKAAEAELAAEPEVVTNVFHAGPTPEWDWDKEKEYRAALDKGIPYVIHRDEYFHNDMAWDQSTLTYFSGDDMLADDQDTPIDDQDAIVGLANLGRFGHGSGDPNIVYVRNPELELEYEILLSEGKFSEQRRGIAVDDPPRDESGRFVKPQETDPRKRRSRGNTSE